MTTRGWPLSDAEEQEVANRQTASLGGVAVTLLLIIFGMILVRELHAKASIEDCLMAGRTNCDLVVEALR
jgi:hypothetical protein